MSFRVSFWRDTQSRVVASSSWYKGRGRSKKTLGVGQTRLHSNNLFFLSYVDVILTSLCDHLSGFPAVLRITWKSSLLLTKKFIAKLGKMATLHQIVTFLMLMLLAAILFLSQTEALTAACTPVGGYVSEMCNWNFYKNNST